MPSLLARAAVAAALSCLAPPGALAQATASAAVGATPAAPAVQTEASASAPEPARTAGAVVPAGTRVIVEIVNPLSSKTIKRGDMFAIRLAAPITFEGRVVVPAGAEGQGQVVDAAPSHALGTPAKLLLAARYIGVDGTHVPLHGMAFGSTGQDQSMTVLAASFVPYVGVLAMFMHGGEVEIPAGSLAAAKLSADLPVPAPAADGAVEQTTAQAAAAPTPTPAPASPPASPTTGGHQP